MKLLLAQGSTIAYVLMDPVDPRTRMGTTFNNGRGVEDGLWPALVKPA